ncbi:hypothetical protein C8Q69DRAFT_397094, partial [Paecilomyces variotii]
DYWAIYKTNFLVNIAVYLSANFNNLEPKQRDLYNLIIDYYIYYLNRDNPAQLLINLDKKAKIGKSYIIMLILSVLVNIANKR